tara:strand:- start:1625 stop:2149 length:525 start_codon:yes stop_codon:yes gene_type:complete
MKNAIKILGILFSISTIISCVNNENTEADYEVSNIDHEKQMIKQQNFKDANLQFECYEYEVKEFSGSTIKLIMKTEGIKSKELGGILASENYLNAKNNPELKFVGENVQKKNDGNFQFVVNGKMKTESLLIGNGSVQLAFNYDNQTRKLDGELKFVKPDNFEGIKEDVIGIRLY